jgi:hypothetical protein
MKRLAKGRCRLAARAGLPGVRPRQTAPDRTSAASEAVYRGYHRGWFVLRTEHYRGCSRPVYAFGAVSDFPNVQDPLRAAQTFLYDAVGPPSPPARPGRC